MESTRRLSLTLLLVTPIIAVRRLSSEDLGLGGALTAWGEPPERLVDPEEDWDSTTELSEAYSPEVYDEGSFANFESWLRRKRAVDSPRDDLETAEQVLFRPTFRYKHLVKEREQRHRLREELRRQSSLNSPVAASSSTSAIASFPPGTSTAQRKYYNTYPQHNQAVHSTTQHNQGLYAPQLPTVQRVYSQQIPTVQNVYSPPISPQGISPQVPPNYQHNVQPPSQYHNLLLTGNNQGFRPQSETYSHSLIRFPQTYPYSQRLN